MVPGARQGRGQGESLPLRNHHARYDYEAAGTPAYEFVAARKDVDPKRVAIMAYSAGGYYAPRAAAFEPRYAACVAWGPHYDYHAVWQKRWAAMQADHNSVATSHFQLPWVLGTKDKTLKTFDEEEGTAEHCQVDNRQMGTDFICDWLARRLA